jgi:hypothetical protein
MITIIGNGESRATINVDNIKHFKVGCNGIYLYHFVDLICAMDKFWRDKIVKESTIPLISRYTNNAFQRTLEIYDKQWRSTNCAYRGYCSGTTALDYVCSQYKNKTIYLIGFDLNPTGEFVNHIYKDTKFHPKSDRPAQNQNIFLKQTLDIVKRYPLHKIYWVNNTDFDIKINKISIEEYKELAYVEMD